MIHEHDTFLLTFQQTSHDNQELKKTEHINVIHKVTKYFSSEEVTGRL